MADLPTCKNQQDGDANRDTPKATPVSRTSVINSADEINPNLTGLNALAHGVAGTARKT